LLDDQAACRKELADESSRAIDRTTRIPRHIGEQFERMATNRDAKQFRPPLPSFQAGRIVERDAGNCSKPGGGMSQPWFGSVEEVNVLTRCCASQNWRVRVGSARSKIVRKIALAFTFNSAKLKTKPNL